MTRPALAADEQGAALGAYGRRQLNRSLAWSGVYLGVVVPVLFPVLEVYWLPLCYAVCVGAGVVCGRRLALGEGTGWRRLLAVLVSGCGVQGSAILIAVWLGCFLAGAVILVLHGLGSTGVSVGEFEKVWAEDVVGAFNRDRTPIALMIGFFLFFSAIFGLIDGTWIGRVSAGASAPFWKALPGVGGWRAGSVRDRQWRREYLLGRCGAEVAIGPDGRKLSVGDRQGERGVAQ